MKLKSLEMKTHVSFFILFLITPFLSGQIVFEKGYFLDNEGNKIECLVKNVDWKYNPSSFEFKLSEYGKIENGTIDSVKELVIYGRSKHVRADVKIDRSPTKLTELSDVRNPIWKQEKLFLKVLVEGKATLYFYGEDDFNRYFYSKEDSINQLIFKEYLVGPRDYLTNNWFRIQLSRDISCKSTNAKATANLGYNSKELIRYFVQYNECHGDTVIIPETKKEREVFHLKVTPGINSSSLSISNEMVDFAYDYGNHVSFRIGIEAQYILPFNMNTWGIILEPAYQYYNSEKQESSGTSTVSNRYLDLSTGVRHYIYLNNKTRDKIFVNGFISSIYSRDFDSNIDYNDSRVLDIHNKLNFSMGAGLCLRRFSAEIRYYTNQELFNYINWYSKNRKVALIFGYKLF